MFATGRDDLLSESDPVGVISLPQIAYMKRADPYLPWRKRMSMPSCAARVWAIPAPFWWAPGPDAHPLPLPLRLRPVLPPQLKLPAVALVGGAAKW